MTTPRSGLPQWGVHDDFNVQQDRFAAMIVFERCRPVVVPLAVTLEVSLQKAHLGRLRQAGELGRLLADQGEMHARDNVQGDLLQAFPALPYDLLNFHYDPLACAVALGWEAATIDEIRTDLSLGVDRLWMKPADDGTALSVVTGVDAPAFQEEWLQAVERASMPK